MNRVILSRSARKQLDRLATETERRIFVKLVELESNPRPSGCKKLANRDAWRIRVGDYRVIYEIHDKVLQDCSDRWSSAGSLSLTREQPDDLQPFDAKQFAQALFEE